MEDDPLNKLSNDDRQAYEEFKARVKNTLDKKKNSFRKEEEKNPRNEVLMTLQPTIFNKTDDHIFDSKLELSPSEIYENQYLGNRAKEEAKENIDKRIKEIEETSIERIKKKYLKVSPEISPIKNVREAPREEAMISNVPKSNKCIQHQNFKKKPVVCKVVHSEKRAPIQSRRKINIPTQVKPMKPSNSMHVKTPSTTLAARKKEKGGLKNVFDILINHVYQCPVLRQILEDNGITV